MSDALIDPRPILLEKINLSGTRVEFTAAHVVLLCGGKVKYREHEEAPDPPIASLRHAITKAAVGYETYRPEDITDWHVDGMFKDLMSFEVDLAGICSLVAIVLESAGAIAELGAFSQLPELSKKIIAIKSRDFETAPHLTSFINLGILRFILSSNDSAVRTYPWSLGHPQSISEEVIDDVVSDIQDELGKIPQSAVFKSSLNSHIVVLICEIISIFTAVKEGEILSYLHVLQIQINKDELKRKLFLLEKFQLLKLEQYSDAPFYMIGKYKYHRLRLSLKGSEHHDSIRMQMECLAYYNASAKQRNRVRAIKQAAIGLQR